MREIFTLDAETDPFKIGRIPKPFLWGLYNPSEGYREYQKPRKLIEFLADQNVICYAHNGGKFDFHFLKEFFEDGQELMIINGRLAKFKIGKCEFRDSYNILPTPLSAYKKDEIDYAIFEESERKKPHNWQKIRDYLRGDCIYLYEYISKFVSLYGMNLTQAGASMKQWTKITEQKPPQSDKEFYEAFKRYYYGGRVQCFRSGDIRADFEMVDINSAYPRAMLENHPFRFEWEINRGTIEPQSFYTVECVANGCFPLRETGRSLWFPKDKTRRQYHVTGWELMAAMDTDSVRGLRIVESSHFDICTSFADFINHFYALRLQAKAEKNDIESLFAKLLMNSLYGKWAANPENYKHYMLVNIEDLPHYDGSAEFENYKAAGTWGEFGLVERPQADVEQRYYNITTAASITGYVRAFLWRAIKQCKGVMYCDTDSIAAKDCSALPRGDSLGLWGSVGTFNRALIAGKKLYAFHRTKPIEGERWKLASKGARLTWQQIEKLCNGQTVEYMPTVPTFAIRSEPHFVKRNLRRTSDL